VSHDPKTHHNAHMWLPRKLYKKVKAQARIEHCSVTHLVVEALEDLIKKKETTK